MLSQDPTPSWLLDGMDANSSYLLEIRLVGNPRCRKEFSSFIFTMVVDSDMCNFKDFVDEIVEKYPPGYHELVSVAYFEAAGQKYQEVKSDQDLLAMFSKHVDSKTVNIAISYNLPTEIPEWPTISEHTHELTPSHPTHEPSTPTSCQDTSQPSTPEGPDDANILPNPDSYYSVEKFRAAYENLIPALTDKAQWQPSNHGFFMHPPLLKSTAGRRKNQRFKGCSEGNTTHKKGQHRCPICQSFGHHWNTCKNGDPDDIAALRAERGPPKKKKKKTTDVVQESTSIVPIALGPTPMYFPPSQGSVCSSQPYALSINLPSSFETPPPVAPTQPSGKRKRVGKAKEKAQGKTKPMKNKRPTTTKKKQPLLPVPPESPAMCTRSKNPESPAMSTRSKRKILD